MEYIGELLKGVVIGIANILPGISGGMLAISMGCLLYTSDAADE